MVSSTRFSAAVHTLLFIAEFQDKKKITSDLIAESTGMNAVTIRNIFRMLKKAELLQVKPGPGGAKLAIAPVKISLYDIYTAVEGTGLTENFNIHQNSDQWCLIGKNINAILSSHIQDISKAMYEKMTSISLADLLSELSEIEKL